MRILSTIVAVLLFLVLFTEAKTIKVPEDFAKIQLAINAAVNGDTVLVAEGTYFDNIKIAKKIVLGSLFIMDKDTSHISKTIIDGGSPSHVDSGSVILLDIGTDTNTVIKGITIQNGKGTKLGTGSSAFLLGGGIAIIGGGATISNNVIKNNTCVTSTCAAGAAGIDIEPTMSNIGPASWMITNNVIVSNKSISSASASIGGVDGGGLALTGYGKVMNNVIKNNSATGNKYGAGGGVVIYGWVNGTDIELRNNSIVSNTASNQGGGINMWVNTPYRPKAKFINNIIAKNTAQRGSAVTVTSGDYTFINNTIANNIGWESILLIYSRGALTFGLLNNIIWNSDAMLEISSLDDATAQFNCIRGSYPGAGNFSANPNFQQDGSYTLSDSSYCIGRGSDSVQIGSVWYAAPKNDIYGTSRPNPSNSFPDVGAVEHSSGTPLTLPWQTATLQFLLGGISRSCLVEIPSKYASQKNLPVVFSMDGYGGNAPTQKNYVQTHLLGDSAGFITVYPEAYQKKWNSGIAANSSWPTPNVDDVAFISAIIDSLYNRYTIDTTRVYSCGMSNGGFMSLRLAAQLSRRIAAVASIGGVMTTTSAATYSASRPVPVMMMHGTADIVVPFNGGVTNWYSVNQTMDFWLQKNLCTLPAETLSVPNSNLTDNSTVEIYTYKSPSSSSQVKLFKIIGGGHEWPGSPARSGSAVINRDIDANVEIWNFFKQFSLTNPGPFGSNGVALDLHIAPSTFSLSQNYPNPFNPSTTIRYSLPSSANVKLVVYDLLGREIATLVNEEQSAGWKEVVWNASGVSSGIYFYKLTAGSFADVKKMIVVK